MLDGYPDFPIEKYFPGKYLIKREDNGSFAIITELNEGQQNSDMIQSENRQVVLHLSTRFFHTIMDSFGIVLSFYSLDPKTKFIILCGETINNSLFQPHILFFFKMLKEKNINFEVIDFKEGSNIKVVNFLYFSQPYANTRTIKLLNEEFSKYVDLNIKPTKKVYLGRKNVIDRGDSFIFNNKENNLSHLRFDNDIRIDNENVIEDYMKSQGFEIIYPEDFNTFEEQLDFMNTVKVIASTTSAGLTNAIFMQEETTMIELTTPLIVQGSSSYHLHYYGIAASRNIFYRSLPHMRQEQDIIRKIEKSRILVGLDE